jgi:hypothetical protein
MKRKLPACSGGQFAFNDMQSKRTSKDCVTVENPAIKPCRE